MNSLRYRLRATDSQQALESGRWKLMGTKSTAASISLLAPWSLGATGIPVEIKIIIIPPEKQTKTPT